MNYTTTTNGAKTNSTSGKECLDLFTRIGNMRYDDRLRILEDFEKAYKDKNLAPENLSRTLEDSGTVTSVLIPWNTCGAYQSGVLGVSVSSYFFYAFFNWISPFMTLLFAALHLKIKSLKEE